MGNLISKIDRDGFNTTFEYDVLNKLSKVKYSNEKEVRYEYNELGQLISVSDWLGENKFEIDSIGRIKKLTDSRIELLNMDGM